MKKKIVLHMLSIVIIGKVKVTFNQIMTKKNLLQVFLKIADSFFNMKTPNNVRRVFFNDTLILVIFFAFSRRF